ncbi:MAG: cytochrome c biogenesis protein ResB [Symploca sp. SIO1B1]|nr:cytochrome c biogenesis protein ResB [Symploca sp. SIO1B1]
MKSNPIFRFLGSIKLAVPLLTAIVIILIGATFYESQVGSTTVQQQIYKSPWFGALMFLLAMNLGASALSRYPWRGARKIGFALTHTGLIIIIAGAAAVIHLGSEGMLLVRTDGGANSQIRVEGDLLEVMSPNGEVTKGNVWVKADGSLSPHQVGQVSLISYTDQAIKTVRFNPGGVVKDPAVNLSLTSSRMGQKLDRWLAIAPSGYSKISLGPAELEILAAESDSELQSLLSPPSKTEESPWGKLQVSFQEQQQTIGINLNNDESVELGNLTLKVVNFWPDFRLNSNNQPTSVSNNLGNPAVKIQLTTPDSTEQWFVFGRQGLPPVRGLVSGEPIEDLDIKYQISPQPTQDYFNVIVTAADKLYYRANSSQGFKSGSLNIGQSVNPGWADFQITLEQFIPQAQLQREVIPVADANVEGLPALLVKLPSGTQTWLPWGEPTVVADANEEWLAAFSPKLLQLPFAIKLEDFIVEHNEGSESVAMWTSKIRIIDPHDSFSEQRRVWMNHPTWYKGWKIAQASWNPGDLQQSTLQVKREPAWVTALTWSGSGLVVLGIAVMFYGPLLAKKLSTPQPKSENPPVETTTPEVLTNV